MYFHVFPPLARKIRYFLLQRWATDRQKEFCAAICISFLIRSYSISVVFSFFADDWIRAILVKPCRTSQACAALPLRGTGLPSEKPVLPGCADLLLLQIVPFHVFRCFHAFSYYYLLCIKFIYCCTVFGVCFFAEPPRSFRKDPSTRMRAKKEKTKQPEKKTMFYVFRFF